MALLSPKSGALVGGLARLLFSPPIQHLDIRVNGANFHVVEDAEGFAVDLNDFLPDLPIRIQVDYLAEGIPGSEEVVVHKPRHNLAGMGATVIRDADGQICGTFFKFWLPGVPSVYIRGSFNKWINANRLHQLGESGYWYGFSAEARPGDDYRFFVYGPDGNNNEVSDPAARETIKTRHNEPEDANNANAVIADPEAFNWVHDAAYQEQRRDFSCYLIYQLHWGTFLRPENEGDLVFEKFVTGETDEEKRKSVRRKLRHVRKLGFTAIQLLPIHQANGNFNGGYDPSFFFAVETAYGRPDDLRLLVDEAHGLGLAVLFDSVINHLTRITNFASFSQEFLKGWYTRENAPWSNHNQWGGEDWGPDPDFDREEIRNLLRDSVRMYFEEYHVDGVRLDATTTIPKDALRSMVEKLHQEYGGRGKYLIAEHLTEDPFPYIIGEIGLYGCWYKPAWAAATYQVLGQVGPGNLQKLRQLFEANDAGSPATAVKYLLGSHDENWASHGGLAAVTRFGGAGNFYARSKMRLAWALNVCALGTPMLFMGTEGMSPITWHNYFGYNGHNLHTPGEGLAWKPEAGSHGARFRKMVADINRLYLEQGAFRMGNDTCKLVHWDEQNSLVAYKRWDYYGCVLLMVINLSDHQWQSREYRVQTDTPQSTWQEVFNSQSERYGGWQDSGNGEASFLPHADGSGNLQGINVPQWSLLLFKQQL
ncbi:MAG: alpha-amylase family glycosyl hydrolase [Adhaeribacter sp.]